ncbi:hypothetical protein EYF80_016937 [Liparis tanakae]|uniref:Uncharacterized protein n=1 Tax=Liparis tanakae TaxID=230148 RepID=A0A4Z2I423_9TELE|nr:hypothetical protein EYF80_016937 [Liparis tanakae]
MSFVKPSGNVTGKPEFHTYELKREQDCALKKKNEGVFNLGNECFAMQPSSRESAKQSRAVHCYSAVKHLFIQPSLFCGNEVSSLSFLTAIYQPRGPLVLSKPVQQRMPVN